VALALPAGVSAFQAPREMTVKIAVTPLRLDEIAPEVLEFYDVTPEYVTCGVTEDTYKSLVERGFSIEVLVPDVEARARSLDAFFHTYQQLRDTWAIIAQNHPDICVLDTMGTSAGGNLLLVMKISDNPTVMEGEPRICFDFSMHGNENNGCEIAHYSLIQLVSQYGVDPDITRWVNEREIWLAPMDNPDGLISRSRYNAHGVDCNRNYGFAWDGGGPSVFSEPEANCFYGLAEENPMAAWSQYHSGATSAMWPWFYTTRATMDSVVHAYEMQRYGAICNYGAYQISRGLYPGNGGSTCWYYGARGALGYAVEVCSGQPSGVGEIDTVNHKNWSAMKEQIERVMWGVNGYVTDSASGRPVAARVTLNPPNWFTYTDSIGYYHKNVHAGTYAVTVEANGYVTKTVTGVVVPAETCARVNIALAPDTTAPVCAFKVLTSYLNETPANSNPTFASYALGRADGRRFSIGNDGYCSFDMGKETPIINGPGNDFTVYEGDGDPEACSVFVSNDWNSNWRYVGFGTGTQTYDLAVAGLSTARFVRIVDDNSGGSGGNAGYDLDAIEAVVVNAPAILLSAKTVIDTPPGGNNDGKLDPGENAALTVTLRNGGRVGVANLTGVLRTGDEYVSVLDSTGTWGDIGPDSVRVNNVDGFRLAADAMTPREHAARMVLYLAGTDFADSIAFDVVVGELRAVDPIPDGPRQPARFWAYDDVDSAYGQHPQFGWVEINGIGTRLTLSDDQTSVVSIPSAFGPWRYYGQNYTQVSICSNGWISPGSTTNSSYTNASLPDGSAPANLCLLWDDLYPAAGRGVWWYHDAANHRFIVEYDSVCKYSPRGSYVIGQFIIYDTTVATPTGDNVILLQYRGGNDFASSTVGIEDPTATIGINCLADGSYHRGCAPLGAGRAIKYTTLDPTGIAEAPATPPSGLRLEAASPARNRVSLRWFLPAAGRAEVSVFDNSGRLVRRVAAGSSRSGWTTATWDGTDASGRTVAAGTYWVRLTTADAAGVVKAVVLR
jgi:hypothetical protein